MISVLITGASGYLGKEFLKIISKEDRFDVTLVTRSYNPNIKFPQVCGDLNNRKTYQKIRDKHYNLVVHLAGFVPKRREDDSWLLSKKGNVYSTKILLENVHCQKIIYISTAEVYGPHDLEIIDESVIPHPISNYAKSKLLAERTCKRLCKKYNIQLCILRFTTIIGYDDPIERAIPNFFKLAIQNKPLTINGNGRNLRDYIFINDAALAIYKVISAFRKGTYNVSSARGVSITLLAKKITAAVNSHSTINYVEKQDEVSHDQIFSNSSFCETFNFKLEFSLEEAIRNMAKQYLYICFDLDGTLLDITMRWYRLHSDLAKKYGFKQLTTKRYLELKRNGVSESEILRETSLKKELIPNYLDTRLQLIEDPSYLGYDIVKQRVKQTLSRLKSQYSLILVTRRKNSSKLVNQLKRTKLLHYFTKVMCVKRNKASSIKEFLTERPSLILSVVGDSEDDYELAKSLKVIPLIVKDGCRSQEFLSKFKDAQLLNSIEDIPKHLR